jgi:hypothetical protein
MGRLLFLTQSSASLRMLHFRVLLGHSFPLHSDCPADALVHG